jgi:hypothetical protein
MTVEAEIPVPRKNCVRMLPLQERPINVLAWNPFPHVHFTTTKIHLSLVSSVFGGFQLVYPVDARHLQAPSCTEFPEIFSYLISRNGCPGTT